MQHRFHWFALLAALVFGLVAAIGSGSSTVSAQRMFSEASLHGRYGVSYSVALLNPSGLAQFLSGTGFYQADGAGNLTGEETTNTNGKVCSGTLSGTYNVSPNGTGTASVTFRPTTTGCSELSFQQSLTIMDSGRIVRVADTMQTEVTFFEEWRK